MAVPVALALRAPLMKLPRQRSDTLRSSAPGKALGNRHDIGDSGIARAAKHSSGALAFA